MSDLDFSPAPIKAKVATATFTDGGFTKLTVTDENDANTTFLLDDLGLALLGLTTSLMTKEVKARLEAKTPVLHAKEA